MKYTIDTDNNWTRVVIIFDYISRVKIDSIIGYFNLKIVNN